MTARRSIADARKSLPGLVHEAESGKSIELTRHGRPVAVLIGRREFERLTARPRTFGEAYREFAKRTRLGTIDVDPDDVFGGVRGAGGGRKVAL